MKYLQKVLVLLTALLAVTFVSTTAFAATFTVDTADDESDGACPLGDCSLREAIAASAARDTITFDVSLDGSTITLSGGLGTLTVDKALTIDGDIDGTAGPDITIDGTGLSDNAVAVSGTEVTIDGMIIWGGTTLGHNAINVSGDTFVLKNSMVNTDGSINKKDIQYAVRLSGASASIGTGVAGEGNQIGGSVHVNNTTGNLIKGNYIGISSAGNDIAPSSNQASGVEVTGAGAVTVTIGGSDSASRNIISNFDSNNGIKTSNSNGSTTISILGNYIGTNVAGTAAAANQTGVYVSAEANGTVNIGTAAAGNIISGNSNIGVHLAGSNSATVTVVKNYIGTNAAGTSAVANGYGVTVEGCAALTIGDSLNVISGNTTSGISLTNTGGVISMTGAYIGLGADGSTVIANGTGVAVSSTGGTLAIGTAVGSVNVISGSTQHGISVDSTATITPTIRNNYIGLNAAGTAAKANGWNGIKLQKPANVYSNIISGNTWHGIQLTSTVTSADIQSNYIGLNAAGTSAVANGYTGIDVFGATGVAIGTSSGANVISGNTQAGILVSSSGSATILNNKIGTDATGAVTTVGNGNSLTGAIYYGGIMVDTASATIGSGTAGNTIKGNYGQGIIGINTSSLTIKGNTINSNIAGVTTGTANGSGVVVTDSAGGSASTIAIGGTGVGEGNTISGNAEYGVYVLHQTGASGISGVTMYSNTIGSTGAANTVHGVFFKDKTPGGNITSVTIGSSSGPNTITYNGSAGIKFDSMSSGTINSNTVSNNTVHGVHVYASSPTISTNTISSNGGNGIKVESDYGPDKSPSVTADDMRSVPTITGNTVSSNTDVGIYELDSAATNKSTLHTDNTITSSGVNGIAQVWYGALVYTCNGTALTSGISSVTVNGSSGTFATYNGGYWGSVSFNPIDVTTWDLITEFISTSSGKTTYSPNTITVTPTSGATSCTTATGSGTFDGSSYYKTATVALTVPSGGGTILFSSSRSSSRTTTTTEETTETTEEETSRETTTEETTETTEEETSRETTTEETTEPTTETATRETPTYAREESYDRYSPSEATSTTTTRETTSTTSTEAQTTTLSERVEAVREILGVAEETAVTEAVSRAIETLTADTADADSDGITNAEEVARGTNANSFDSDGDGDPDSMDPSPSDPTVISERLTELKETIDIDSDENGMSDRAEYLFGAETTSRELVFGSANGDINLGLSQMAFVTPEGFAVTGMAKPNSKTTVEVTLNDGSKVSTNVETDANGLYIATFDSAILVNVKADDLLLITSEKGKEILAKVTNETIKKPEVKIEGSMVEETSAENNMPKYWSTELVMNRIPEYINQTSFKDVYLKGREKALENEKPIIVTGYAEPNSAVMFVFKSATFSSVVISDKDGYFEMEVPKELKDELSQNADTESALHEFIGFSVDYKTNKISPLVKGLFRIYNLNLSLKGPTG